MREAVRLRPNMVAAQQALAELDLRKNDVDLLDKSAEQLIAVETRLSNGYLFRATARVVRKDLAGGEADLKKPWKWRRKAGGYAAWGDLRASQKRFSEAEKLYDRLSIVTPNFFNAMQGLVDIVQSTETAC